MITATLLTIDTAIPEGLEIELQSLVGSIYGDTYEEVVTFILKHWMHEHGAAASGAQRRLHGPVVLRKKRGL